MDRIHILGGERLEGEVLIGGAKNAALPLMASSLLSSSPLTLSNLPHLVDITTMVQLLGDLGVKISMDGDSPNGGYAGRAIKMDASEPQEKSAPYDLVRKMSDVQKTFRVARTFFSIISQEKCVMYSKQIPRCALNES